MAFICRYGHMDLNVAMSIPSGDTHPFMEAVGKLISEENKAPGGGD